MFINYARFLSTIFATLFLIFSQIAAQEEWMFYENKGLIQFNEKMDKYAILSLQKAVRLNPNAYKSISTLGQIELRDGDKQSARNYFRQSLEINPMQEDTLVICGELEDFYGNNNEAFRLFSEALAINQNNNKAILGCARYYFLSGDTKNGEAFFSRAYELKKNASTKLTEQGQTLFNSKKYNAAVSKLQAALKENPADLNACLILENIYLSRNDKKGALKILEQMKYINPAIHLLYVHIANIYYSGRTSNERWLEIDTAIANIETAIKLNPDESEQYSLMASLFYLKGDAEKANYYSHLFREKSRKDEKQN